MLILRLVLNVANARELSATINRDLPLEETCPCCHPIQGLRVMSGVGGFGQDNQ